MSATTPPASDDDDDDLLDRLRPASMLAHGLKSPTEPVPPAPGPQGTLLAELFHEYRFAGELSHGGFGIVYRAEHRRLKRRAALKLLSHTLTRNAAAVTRFEREIEAVGKLDHPGIVRAFDAGERGGIWFLAMEFIAGMDFARLSKALGPLPPAEVAELGRQAALALHYAHGHGLVHRDVKPSNIMLECPPSSPPSVKILDFGLAQLNSGDTAGLTISAEFLGTVEYIAPEQVENPRCADLRSDLYGLGATLYRLLTGLAPHEQPASKETLLQKLTSVAQASVTPVRTHRPDIPEGLAAVVDRLLQRNPADRLQSGAEIAEALSPWCSTADLTDLAARALAAAPPPEWPAPGRTVRAFRRPGRLKQMLVSASVAAAVCIPLTLWLRSHFAPAPPVAPAPAATATAGPSPVQPPDANDPNAVAQFNADDFVGRMNVPPGKVCVMHDSGLWFPWWGDQLSGAAWFAWLPPGLPQRTAEAPGGKCLIQSNAAGLRAWFRSDPHTIPLAALPEVFAFTASGGYGVWTEAAAAGVLHTVPWFMDTPPGCDEAARFTIPLPPAAVITAITAPPPDWKGTAEIATSTVLLLDRSAAGGIHLCMMENRAGITAHWTAPAGGVPVDAAFSPGGIFLLNSPADRTDFSPVPADISARLFRRDGSTWTACTTDLPLTDPTALAADPRPQRNGELLVLCGHRQPAEAPGSQRFLARLIPDGTDRYRVEVIADNFMTPAPGGLEISHDGTRLVVADKGAKVWYGWCDKDSSRGWD